MAYVQRESRLVSEWMARTFPRAELRTRVRLGALDSALDDANLTEAQLRHLGVFRRWVDGLAIERAAVHLVEGKVAGTPGALEQLDLYARLLPLTPELAELRGRRIQRHLVWAIPDPVIEAMARERGILVHVYYPRWLDELLGGLSARARRAPQPRGLLDEVEP